MLGMKVTISGFFLLLLSVYVIHLFHGKPTPSIWVVVPTLAAFSVGIAAIVSGVFLAIWL